MKLLTEAIKKKLYPWVAAKVVQVLGVPEEYGAHIVWSIIHKVKSREAPEFCVQELCSFADDEAEGIVLSLWRMLIFEGVRSGQ